ncbi:N/A [soil metagenome]
MELRYYLSILRQRMLLVLVTIVAAVAAAYVATPKANTYIAESTIYVGTQSFEDPGSRNGAFSGDRVVGLERLAVTFSAMIDSRPIAERALEISGIARSAGSVVGQTTAAPQPNTQLIKVQVRDRDPATAQLLANSMAEAFVEEVQVFEPGTPTEGTIPALPAYLFEQASLPTVPQPIPTLRNMVLAGLFGSLLAVGLIVLLEHLDVTVKTADDAERKVGLPVLGAIPLSRSVSPDQRPPSRASPMRASRGPEKVARVRT